MKSLIEFKKSLKSTLLGVCALAALGVGSAQGAPLNLTLLDSPDIYSTFITVDYNAGFESLSASGFAIELDDQAIAGGTFDLLAGIDNDGGLELGTGTLNIGGTIDGLGYKSGTLLTGTLTAFGYSVTGGILEFLFDVTGGDAAGLYGGVGSTGGIILGDTGVSGVFNENWSSGAFSAVADVAPPVPLPAAFWLFGSALIGFVGFARRKRA